MKEKISYADEYGQSTDADSYRHELEELTNHIKANYAVHGKPKNERGEYAKIQKKIGKSIIDAMEWMRIQGFEEAYNHFKLAISNPYNRMIQYDTSDASVEWHT